MNNIFKTIEEVKTKTYRVETSLSNGENSLVVESTITFSPLDTADTLKNIWVELQIGLKGSGETIYSYGYQDHLDLLDQDRLKEVVMKLVKEYIPLITDDLLSIFTDDEGDDWQGDWDSPGASNIKIKEYNGLIFEEVEV